MRPSDKTVLPWLVLSVLTITPAFAMEGGLVKASFTAERKNPGNGLACHQLMTEKECAEFRTTLTTLPVGAARSEYLARHFALMRERESMCDPNHLKTGAEQRMPRVRQVLQQF
ncbi:MAG: hypothetical protein AB1831_12465 [Pseudomonadota bacterium]